MSQAQLILIGFLLATQFLAQGPAEGFCYSEKQKPCVGKRRKLYSKGKQIPFLDLSKERVAWPLKVVKSPPKPGSCLSSRSPAHYLPAHSFGNPILSLVPALPLTM